ncbi:MAG: hypothetical protein QW369_05935 [Desulfurococcaceae archaeon]
MRDRELLDALDEGSPRGTPRCGVPEVALKAPKGDANPRLMQGNKNEAMKSTDIKLYKS